LIVKNLQILMNAFQQFQALIHVLMGQLILVVLSVWVVFLWKTNVIVNNMVYMVVNGKPKQEDVIVKSN